MSAMTKRADPYAASQSMQQGQLVGQLTPQQQQTSLGRLLDRVEALEGERARLLEALKRSAVAVSFMPSGVVCVAQKIGAPSVHVIARALWCSDERVYEKAAEVGDYRIPCGYSSMKRSVVLQKMWDRDEGGWRTQAYSRAKHLCLFLEQPARMDVVASATPEEL